MTLGSFEGVASVLRFRRGVLGVALVSAAVFGLVTSASADGMPGGYSRAPFSWTGIYIGGNAGAGWGDTDWTFVDTVPPGHTPIPAGFAEGSHRVSGGLAGGQIGANWQIGHWVLGGELKWDWADLSGDHFTPTFHNL